LTAPFFATTGFGFDVAAFFVAHRFFKAATMFALPALLSFRFGFDVSVVAGAGGLDSPRIFAHRSCPSNPDFGTFRLRFGPPLPCR
jgi:hypothetical protein